MHQHWVNEWAMFTKHRQPISHEHFAHSFALNLRERGKKWEKQYWFLSLNQISVQLQHSKWTFPGRHFLGTQLTSIIVDNDISCVESLNVIDPIFFKGNEITTLFTDDYRSYQLDIIGPCLCDYWEGRKWQEKWFKSENFIVFEMISLEFIAMNHII